MCNIDERPRCKLCGEKILRGESIYPDKDYDCHLRCRAEEALKHSIEVID